MRSRFAGGFTYTEIIVALLLLAGFGAAALSSFSSASRMVRNDPNIAYNFARGLMERLPEHVRQDTWSLAGLPLSLSGPGPQNIASTLGGQTYTATYQVNGGSGVPIDRNADGKEDYRTVKMTVSW